MLELLFDGREAAAVAIKTVLPSGRSATFEVYRGATLVYREDGSGRVFTPAVCGGGSGGGGGDTCENGADSGSRHTHAVVVSRTPFVKHLDFIMKAGASGEPNAVASLRPFLHACICTLSSVTGHNCWC